MKITIDVDLEPSEVPLATELIRALKTLTDQVRTRTAGAPAPSPAPSAPVVAAQAPHTQRELLRLLGSLSVNSAPSSADVASLSASFAQQALQLPLGDVPLTSATALVTAVCTILNDPMIGQRMEEGTASVAPFAKIAIHLPDLMRREYTRQLCERVMADLSQKRPKGTPRLHVFALAEVFARLVELGELPIAGAVNSIVRLLKNPEKRMAAVTMLGKTVEVCFAALTERCDKACMNALRDELGTMRDPEYEYDVSYVFECLGGALGWGAQPQVAPPPPPPPPPPAPAPPPPQPAAPQMTGTVAVSAQLGLEPVWSHVCRPGTIYTMALDAARGTVVTAVNYQGSPDVAQVWAQKGFVGEFSLGSNMVTSLDILKGASVMLAASMPSKGSTDPCNVRLFTPSQQEASGWQTGGMLVRPNAKPLVALRWLPTDYAFALGERDGDKRDLVAVFQLDGGNSFSTLQPLSQFAGHSNLITCLETVEDMRGCVLSASMDRTIRLWDRNAPGGATGVVIGTNAPGTPAHGDMVNTLSARGHVLVSGSVDGTVAQWDLRYVARGPAASTNRTGGWLDAATGPVLKVALGSEAVGCAASTAQGHVFSLDSAGGGSAPRRAPPWAHATATGRYHGLLWDRDTNLLYGGYTTGAPTTDTAAAQSAHMDVWRARS